MNTNTHAATSPADDISSGHAHEQYVNNDALQLDGSTLAMRAASDRPADVLALSIGELVALSVAGPCVEARSMGEAVAAVTAEELDLLECATTDGVVLDEGLARDLARRLSSRARALAELARRIRLANAANAE